MKNKIFAIGPDGKERSKNTDKNYSHAVFVNMEDLVTGEKKVILYGWTMDPVKYVKSIPKDPSIVFTTIAVETFRK